MWRIKWNVKRFWVGELDLDRVDLADLTGIRPGTIGEIMNDAHDSVSLDTLARICEALHRNVDEVLLLVKDTDELEGADRDKAILDSVADVRKKRAAKNAEKRAKKIEARRHEEEQLIQAAVEKALKTLGLTPSDIAAWDNKPNDEQDPDADKD